MTGKKEQDKQTRFFSCRFEKSLYERLQAEAMKNHRSVTGQVFYIIERYINNLDNQD
jgi:predicted DNA-binding protein